jgi:DNA adenine methylase
MMDNTILLKWPGGKRLLLKHIFPYVPPAFNDYYEPFFGGGALFFALQPTSAILADKNAELINCYKQVRDHPKEIISYLSELKNTKEDYYNIRNNIPNDEISKAARLIYLMALSFNGIHRVNEQGKFNVPYSNNTQAIICNRDKINVVSLALASSKLLSGDFEATVANAKKGDFVYFDPPYTVAHSNNGFVKYNAHIFSWADQERLAKVANELVTRGCHVLISNADHPTVEKLYCHFNMQRVTRSSAIAASSEHRRPITECLFYS